VEDVHAHLVVGVETLDKLDLGRFENPGPPITGTFVLAERLKWLLQPIETDPTPCPRIETELTA
jgi:hypothetical protein